MSTGVSALAAMRDLDVGGDAAQVRPVCGFCQIPNFGILAGAVINGFGISQGNGVKRDAGYVPVALRAIVAAHTDD